MAKRKQWSEMSRKEKTSGVIGIIILLFIVSSVVNAGSKTNKAADNALGTNKSSQDTSVNISQTPTESKSAPTQPAVPAEYKSALSQADSYANTLHMSKQGVYDQLVSQYGGKFTAEAAQYAIDNVNSDWNANALASAKNYQDNEHLSPAAIHDQLTSAYGEKFTQPEADYAIQHLND